MYVYILDICSLFEEPLRCQSKSGVKCSECWVHAPVLYNQRASLGVVSGLLKLIGYGLHPQVVGRGTRVRRLVG